MHAVQPDRPKKKKLDTLVKLALGVFFGSFALIWGGMFLSRPDRSIPPYSIGSQEGTVVAVHVPGWTSDAAIETLIERFRKVGREARRTRKRKGGSGPFSKGKIQLRLPPMRESCLRGRSRPRPLVRRTSLMAQGLRHHFRQAGPQGRVLDRSRMGLRLGQGLRRRPSPLDLSSTFCSITG